jgi:hypothetical protein
MLLTKYYLGDQVKTNEVGGACGMYGEEKRVLMEKPKGKRPLGRPRHIWEDNIKMDFKEIVW